MKQPIAKRNGRKLPGLFALCGLLALSLPAPAIERLFTYTHEPETLPKGALEFEQWITTRAGRNRAVGQADYHRFQFREELEYGVTDRYQIAFYFNHDYEHFHDPTGDADQSDYRQKGVSFENKLLVLHPAERPVGLALYLEPTLDAAAGLFKLEEKIILGQRHGDWKWAVNLNHETEWEHQYRDTVGEFELTAGVAYLPSPRWSLGVEMRHHAEIEAYRKWEGYAFYLGPSVSYRRERWWAALTVMPQIYGANFEGNPDRETNLDLAGHERWNIRLLVGIHLR
jgi:hypothetical protein